MSNETGAEIERRFLVEPFRRTAMHHALAGSAGQRMVQGYLNDDPARAVRIRIAGEDAWLTIKGKRTGGIGAEEEISIDINRAQRLMPMCLASIEKIRHTLPACWPDGRPLTWPDGRPVVWEIDVFAGAQTGLVLAEIELPSIDQPFASPDWLGREITDDHLYANQAMAFSGSCPAIA